MKPTRSKREILTSSPLVANLLPAELTMLADLFSYRDVAAGASVYAPGDAGDAVYVVVRGAVTVSLPRGTGEVLLARLPPPAFFGEMALIDREPRTTHARAEVASQLLQLSQDNLHTFAKHYRNGFTWVVVNIARSLARRLRATNVRLLEGP